MFASNKSIFLSITIAVIFVLLPAIEALPSIRHHSKRFDTPNGIDFIPICLNNCAQCKEMFGDYFKGQTCAESCLKFKGKSIPDCQDIGSIAPFLKRVQ